MSMFMSLVKKTNKLTPDVHDVDVFVLRGSQEVSPWTPVHGRHVVTPTWPLVVWPVHLTEDIQRREILRWVSTYLLKIEHQNNHEIISAETKKKTSPGDTGEGGL